MDFDSIQHGVERFRGPAFLVAGSALLGSTALKALGWFTPVSPPALLVVLFAFPGLVAAFVGLAGLYPTLAERRPRAAVVGGLALVVSGIGLLVVFGWGTAALLLSIPSPPDFAFVTLVATLALVSGLFGVACLRSGDPFRTVGLSLLGFAGTWAGLVIVGITLGAGTPAWLYFLIYGSQPLLLLSAGRALEGDRIPTGTERAAGDAIAG